MNSRLKKRLLVFRWWIFHMNERQLRRWLYTVTRPASYPYISGDGFRRVARFVYDETNQRILPKKVRDGDIIFVSTEYASRFFDEIDPGIESNYRLITHNADVPVDERLIASCSDKIRVWFAQNNTYAHPKVVPIPIGLENLHYYHVGVPKHYMELGKYGGPRKNRILSGFTVATNPRERQIVQEFASHAPCADPLPARLGQATYLQTLVAYKFVLAPPGNGMDTHRAWEAMYAGVIPMVKDSVAMRAFDELGLPLWILRSWEELLSITEHDLERKYAELAIRFRAPALFMDYWRERVLDGEAPVRARRRMPAASQ